MLGATGLNGTEIYGPILDQVYQEESKVAAWPRIVVGPDLVDYLEQSIRAPKSDLINAVRSGLAGICRELIAQDSDDCFIIDYLGPGMKKHLGSTTPYSLIEKAIVFVDTEYAKFQAQDCEKLAARYGRVKNYCEARKDIWK